MNKFKTILLSLVLVLMIGIISCRLLLEEIMPASVDKRAAKYANIDPEELEPYPTLADVKRIKVEIILNHRDQQLSLKRQAEDDNLDHNDALGFINSSIAVSEANLDMIIGSENNPFSIMGILVSLGIGGGGLAFGRRFLKRPGDFTPEEHKCAVVEAKNGKVKSTETCPLEGNNHV